MAVITAPSVIERFSFECRKTKTKVVILTNHNTRRQSNEPIRTRRKFMLSAPSAGKRMRASHVWFKNMWRKWCEIFYPITSVAVQNQSNHEITFDTELKAALVVITDYTSAFDLGEGRTPELPYKSYGVIGYQFPAEWCP